MSPQWTVFRSTVARRLLLLFVLCALVPVGALAIVSFTHVTRQLTQQSERRLQQASKSAAMTAINELYKIERELELLSASGHDFRGNARPPISRGRGDQLEDRLHAITLVPDRGTPVSIYGPPVRLPLPRSEAAVHLGSGKALMRTDVSRDGTTRVFLTRALTVDTGPALLHAELDITALVRVVQETVLPPHAELCVLGLQRRVIACSLPGDVTLPADALRSMGEAVAGHFSWEHEGEVYLASYWNLFLKPSFFASPWTLVVSEPRHLVLAPIASFRTTFPAVIALSVFLVSLLSIRQIRKRMGPLEQLQEGTRRIANRDFDVVIKVDSDDEFEVLADSFNDMAERLNRQFDSLATMIEIDRAILSAVETESIVNTILERTGELYACDSIGLVLVDPDHRDVLLAFYSHAGVEGVERVQLPSFSAQERERLSSHAEYYEIEPEESIPYLAPLARAGARRAFVFPLFVQQDLAGLLCVGHRDAGTVDSEHLIYARQIANQAAIALSNARSIQRNRILAYHDSLTGLGNRLLFKERLDTAISHARRTGRLVAVCLLDLDGFKRVNDTLGHDAGDRLLQEMTARLSETTRSGSLARLGGDEFAIILADTAVIEDAARLAQRVLTEVERPCKIDAQEVIVTASIGIAIYPDDGRDVETIVKNADAAMYHAKDGGRNNYQFFTADMNEAASRRFALEGSLRRALEREEFRVFYQPLVEAASGSLVGMEALVRWEHPEHGLMAPDRFIPLAEETGLIVPLGEWILGTACAQTRAWHALGFQDLRVSVNLSGRQLKEADLLDTVTAALVESQLPARHLILELTEGMMIDAGAETMAKLTELRDLGIALAIDDFGTGYSSLSYLRNFPIEELKIDRSFIQDLTQRPEGTAIIRAIIAMAHSLRLTVVAEGVESEAELRLLREDGCDWIQGFIFGQAVPPDEFEKLLHEWNETSHGLAQRSP